MKESNKSGWRAKLSSWMYVMDEVVHDDFEASCRRQINDLTIQIERIEQQLKALSCRLDK